MHICVVVTLWTKSVYQWHSSSRSRELRTSGHLPVQNSQHCKTCVRLFRRRGRQSKRRCCTSKQHRTILAFNPVIIRAFITSAALHGPSNSLGGECPARRSLQRSAGLAAHVAAISRRVQSFHPAFESMFFMYAVSQEMC